MINLKYLRLIVNNGARMEDVELSAPDKKVLQLSPENIMYACPMFNRN